MTRELDMLECRSNFRRYDQGRSVCRKCRSNFRRY